MNKRFTLLLLLSIFISDASAGYKSSYKSSYKPSVKAAAPAPKQAAPAQKPVAVKEIYKPVLTYQAPAPTKTIAATTAAAAIAIGVASADEDKKQAAASKTAASAININTDLTKRAYDDKVKSSTLDQYRQKVAERNGAQADQPAQTLSAATPSGAATAKADNVAGQAVNKPVQAASDAKTGTISINSGMTKGAYDVDASKNTLAEVKRRMAEREEAKNKANRQGQYASGYGQSQGYNNSRDYGKDRLAADFQISNFDKIMLALTVNNAIDAARTAAMYRAHYNDPEVAAWRNRMQAQAANDPAMADRYRSFEEASKKSKTPVRFCAGVKGGMYASRVESVAMDSEYPIEVVYTNGADDNNNMIMDGKCDIALSQSNLADYVVRSGKVTRSIGLMLEPLMLACKREYKSIEDIPMTANIAVADKTGSSETLDQLKAKSSTFSGKQVVPAITFNEAVDYVLRDKAECVFFVSHPESAITKAADSAKLHLVGIDYSTVQSDSGLSDYTLVAIDGSHFSYLDSIAWTPGVAVDTVMLVNNGWLGANRDAYSHVYDQMQKSVNRFIH